MVVIFFNGFAICQLPAANLFFSPQRRQRSRRAGPLNRSRLQSDQVRDLHSAVHAGRASAATRLSQVRPGRAYARLDEEVTVTANPSASDSDVNQ